MGRLLDVKSLLKCNSLICDDADAKGADPNEAEADGTAPLHVAAQNGHVEVIEVLIDGGADPNQAANGGFTPLWIASLKGHVDVVRKLMEKGADAHKATDDGTTALAIGAMEGHKDIVVALLESGASPDAANNHNKETPLMIAAYRGHTDVVQALIDHKADTSATDSLGKTALEKAAEAGQQEITKILGGCVADAELHPGEELAEPPAMLHRVD